MCETMQIAVNSVINWSFFHYICCFSIFSSNFVDCESGVTICNQFRIRRTAHATTSSTRPFDSPCPISYRYSIATKSVSPAVFEIMGIKYNGTWESKIKERINTFLGHVTSSVMWSFDSPCHITDRCSMSPNRYLQPFSRYWALSILGHDLDLSGSRDVIGHVTNWFPGGHFLLVVHCQQVSVTSRYRDIGL